MPRHDTRVTLRHMIDAAREAVGLAAGRGREDLERDRMLELSLLHLVTILGEAATRIPPEVRARLDSVPWADIVGMRNRIVHGYDVVDRGVLWSTVAEDLPGLVRLLEASLGRAD